MFYKIKDRAKLLEVPEEFATLNGISAGSGALLFDFSYKVSQRDAIAKNATSVIVTVFTTRVQPPSVLKSSNFGAYDTQGIIDAALTLANYAQIISKTNVENVVLRVVSDITSRINNAVIPQLVAGVPSSDIMQTYKPSLKTFTAEEIKSLGENAPVLQLFGHATINDLESQASASVLVDVQKLAYDMIMKEGVDPSIVTSLTHRSISSTDSFLGTLRPKKTNEADDSATAKLLNYYLFNDNVPKVQNTTQDINDKQVQQVLVVQSEDMLEMNVSCRFVDKIKKAADFVQYFVRFELINKDGVALDSVVKQLDVKQHVDVYNTPKKPPLVRLVSSNGKRSLEVKQGDDIAHGIAVYERTLNTTNFDVEPYVLKGVYSLKPKTFLNVDIDPQQRGVTLYRVIPLNGDTMGFEFSNVVFKGKNVKISTVVSIDTEAVDNGFKVSARAIPPNVVSIQFMVKNKTTLDASYTMLSTPFLVDDSVRANDIISVVHTDVRKYNVYEYACKLVLDDGIEELCTGVPVEFMPFSNTTVDTQISDVVVSHDGKSPNVVFSIQTQVSDTTADRLLSLLKETNTDNLFQSDLENDRELLKSLVAHNIQRVDTSTGEREDFGIIQTSVALNGQITSSSFNDNKLRTNSAVSPLKLGHRYRYEVFVLLRDPETLFRGKKTSTDVQTGREYSWSPAKYRHPFTLRDGTLLGKQDSAARFVKSAFHHGNIGLTQTLNVSFDDDTTNIVNARAALFDKRTVVVTWSVTGDISIVDHFLVYKQVYGVRTFVGKVHNNLKNGVYFQHVVGSRDKGPLKYNIVPVFDDFKIGTTIETNQVVV